MLREILDLFLKLDERLAQVVQDYGTWSYAVLFIIIFCETGLVVTPILPGDSLLFAAGALAAKGSLDPWVLCGLLIVAAVLGDAVNYSIGKYLGPKVLRGEGRFLKREYLDRTHKFFEKFGGATIIIARFAPIIRTFAPFLAGVGSMTYWRFAVYNVVGAIAWVSIFVFGGYFFGTIPFVQNNFELVIIAIVVISLAPAAIEWWRHRVEGRKVEESKSPKVEE